MKIKPNCSRLMFFAICGFLLCTDVRVAGQEQNVAPAKLEPLIRLGKIDSGLIGESSGLALCGSAKDAIWTHNDSGNPPEVYLLANTGKLLATTTLEGASNIDWEAMCLATVNGKTYLVIGDVGDNQRKRPSCHLYVYPEPQPGSSAMLKTTPARIEFKYPGGARNCEAISFDASTGDVWLIEKRYVDDRQVGQPGIFTLPLQTTSTNKTLVAKRIGDFPVRNVTDMAFSPDGTRLIIRNYLNAHLYDRSPDKSWRETVTTEKPKLIVLPIQRQGEAICFTADSKSVIVTSEVKGQPIWLVNLEVQSEFSKKQ